MKKVNGEQALEAILKIGKVIYRKNDEINDSKIFGIDACIEILPGVEISDIVAILTDNVLSEKDAKEINEIYKSQGMYEEAYKAQKGNVPDWVTNIVYDYYEDKIAVQELIRLLLEE